MLTKKNNPLIETIGEMLRGANRIMLLSHVRPDGDALGSVIGMGLALQAAGKQVQMVMADGVPTPLRFIEGYKQVTREPKGDFDLRVMLDCSDLQRGGLAWTEDAPPDLNIDHHVTNVNYARVNLVEPEAVATAAILAEYLEDWGFAITPEAANALLAGLVSDTLGFRTSNISPRALQLAAELMQKGADLPEVYSQALMRRSFDSARFWAVGLDRLQRENGLVWTSLYLQDRIKVNCLGNDDADLINFLATIEDGIISVIFVEQKEGNVKVSWRAQPGMDVSKIALRFGGGGHPAAAGAMIAGTMDAVQQQVLAETLSLFEKPAEVQGDTSPA
jgi:phosphoesterase RecJ-like protein